MNSKAAIAKALRARRHEREQVAADEVTRRAPARAAAVELARTRAKIERRIESHLDAVGALIAQLDELDGDADPEPSLGSLSPLCARPGDNWLMSHNEEGQDDREVDDDFEPSLDGKQTADFYDVEGSNVPAETPFGEPPGDRT